MANKHKGEVEFEAEGKKYTLRFSADAICNLEDKFDKPLAELGNIFGDPKRLRMSTVRGAFEIALRDKHPDIDDTAMTAIFRSLTVPDAVSLVVRAFTTSFGADMEAEGNANPQQPGKPDAGSSPAS